MATLREIRRKIQSVGNTQKITQAMEVVAASLLRRAQAKAEQSRPYASKLEEMLGRLITASDELKHPLISRHEGEKIGLVVIAGDRGLCGGYNHSVFHAAEKFLHEKQAEVIPVGRKSVDYFSRKKWSTFSPISEWGGKITYSQIEAFTKVLMDAYLIGKFDEIWLVYTHFINAATREIRIEKFLNIEIEVPREANSDYIFEPDAATIFSELLPRYCTTKIQSALNDAYASELAARISSMRAATKNAGEMIEALTLVRNKVRQAGITKELIEITSGAQNLR